jgi:hypothetical protein
MHIPAVVMQGHSTREITISAADLSGNKGQTSVTLLRRSLFPLD